MSDNLRSEALVEVIAARALDLGIGVGSAESLTGGQVATRLAAGRSASAWFRGGVVAYAPQVKFGLLGVEQGPLNCASCAEQMARGALTVLGCDVAVSTTGVGGPDPDDGVPAGTVFVALASRSGDLRAQEHHFGGGPSEVVGQTVAATLGLLHEHLRSRTTPPRSER